MNKYIVSFACLLAGCSSYAQQFFDGGLKNSFGPTVLINEAVLADNKYLPKISVGNSAGLKLGFNFNEIIELVAEAYFGNIHQKFTIKNADSSSWSKDINFTQIQLPFLFRINRSIGSYFEIGPQYVINKKVSETNSTGNKSDAAKYYDNDYYGAVVGFGSYMAGWDNVGISAGLRFTYTINDIIGKEGGSAPADMYSYKAKNYDPYMITTPLTVGLVIEVNYDLGYLAKSPCGKRRQFLLF